MATIAPLAYELPPFWHPLSVAIHLAESLSIDSDQKQLQLVSNESVETHDTTTTPNPHTNNAPINTRKRSLSITYHGEYAADKDEVDQYVNDVFQVFGKVFYSQEYAANLKNRKYLESLGGELSGFLHTLFHVYYGNLSAMKKYHDDPHTSSFVKKALATFSHPCFVASNTGVEVSLHLTAILGTLLRLADWSPEFLHRISHISSSNTTTDSSVGGNLSVLLTPHKSSNVADSTAVESKRALEATSDAPYITPNNVLNASSVNADLATAITSSFRAKLLDRWAQFASIIGATAATLDDLRKALAQPVSGSLVSNAASSRIFPSLSSSSSASVKTPLGAQRHSFLESIKLSGSLVAQLLWSHSQTQLFQTLVIDTVDSYLAALDRARAAPEFMKDGANEQQQQASKKLLHFGSLWRGRWDVDTVDDKSTEVTSSSVGEDTGGGFEGVDVLSLLCRAQVPLWMHDLSPVALAIESVALKQFSRHKSSIRIFLEMVLIQKTDKLMLLAKADRNVMGAQLLTLLGYDTESEKGRNALRKNAFALMRLQKYRYAIATFLYASPPMLKEACSVACKQLNDPFLALFIARYVEFQQGCRARPGGLILGPCSRSVISQHILPTISDWLKDRSNTSSSSDVSQIPSQSLQGVRLPTFLDQFPDRHVDVAMLALVCALWLQDISLFQSTLQSCLQYGAFHIGDPADRVIYKANLLDSNDKLEVYLNRVYNVTTLCSAVQWMRSLSAHFMSLSLLETVLLEFQKAVSSYGTMHESIEVYRVFQNHAQHRHKMMPSSDSEKSSAFIIYCRDALNEWKVWAASAPAVAASEQTTPDVIISDIGESDPTNGQDTIEEDDDVKIARMRLSKLTAVDSIPPNKPALSSNKSTTQINHAEISDAMASTTTQAPVKSGLFNLAKVTWSTPATTTTMDTASPSALDIFDMPVQRPSRSEKPVEPVAVKSALDIFDMPIEWPGRVKAPVESSAPAETSSAQSAPNAWDIFDAPSRPARK